MLHEWCLCVQSLVGGESRSIRSSRTLAVKFRLLQVSLAPLQKSQPLCCLAVWGVMEHVVFCVFRQRRSSRQDRVPLRPPWSHPVCVFTLMFNCGVDLFGGVLTFWPVHAGRLKCCWMTSSLGGGAHRPPSTSRPMGAATCRKWSFRREKQDLSSAKEERPLNSYR